MNRIYYFSRADLEKQLSFQEVITSVSDVYRQKPCIRPVAGRRSYTILRSFPLLWTSNPDMISRNLFMA